MEGFRINFYSILCKILNFTLSKCTHRGNLCNQEVFYIVIIKKIVYQ